MKRSLILLVAAALFAGIVLTASPAQLPVHPAEDTHLVNSNGVSVIDLPAALQLAGARNLDIQIAREKLAEAKANHAGTQWQFFPSIAPGVGYRRHDNLIQNVE